MKLPPAWQALAALAVLFAGLASAGDMIPPPPAQQDFLSDFAHLLPPEAKARIKEAQKTAFETYNTPIVVVTIDRMSDYGVAGVSIEDFARHWFNQWRIGTLEAREAGANKGILLLVSAGDRRARIELGADWGRNWDAASLEIMSRDIVPRFKEGNYPEGIARGVERLAELAAMGPASPPPPPSLLARLTPTPQAKEAFAQVSTFSLLPPALIVLALAGGVVLIVLSFFFPDQRKLLLVSGIGLIVAALLTWVFLFLLAAFSKRGQSGSDGGTWGSGGGYSGGGFSGGFSGGGGASGSW